MPCKLTWKLTNEYGKVFTRGLDFNKIKFRGDDVLLHCDGYRTTRDYKFLVEHDGEILCEEQIAAL